MPKHPTSRKERRALEDFILKYKDEIESGYYNTSHMVDLAQQELQTTVTTYKVRDAAKVVDVSFRKSKKSKGTNKNKFDSTQWVAIRGVFQFLAHSIQELSEELGKATDPLLDDLADEHLCLSALKRINSRYRSIIGLPNDDGVRNQ